MTYVSLVIIGIMVIFSCIGIIDKIFYHDTLGYGAEFEKGINTIGPLCISMVGIIALVPEITYILKQTLCPLYESLALDPSLAVTSILAIDMGGYQLAMSIASNELIGKWAGIIFASLMGTTIVFTIPVGLGIIKKEDNEEFCKGIIFGLASIPLGAFVGGLILGIDLLVIIKNLIIPIVFSIFIIICIIYKPNQTVKVFTKIGSFISALSLIGLGLAIIKDLVLLPLSDMGLFNINDIFFFNILGSIKEGLIVVGLIGLMLSGALPFVYWLKKVLNKPFKTISKRFGITEVGITGILLSSANNIAMFATLKDMPKKEKIINVAYAVPAAFIIGDDLAFAASNARDCIIPMMIAKLVSGVLAIIIASLYIKKIDNKNK